MPEPEEPPADPRLSPAPLAEVPGHVAEGARRYNRGDFWHAHEAWEAAWHGLRAAGRDGDAAYVQGLVFVTASFENLRRGRAASFRRQLAKALGRLQGLRGAGAGLGLADEAGFLEALARVARDAEARSPQGLGDLREPPPRLEVRG